MNDDTNDPIDARARAAADQLVASFADLNTDDDLRTVRSDPTVEFAGQSGGGPARRLLIAAAATLMIGGTIAIAATVATRPTSTDIPPLSTASTSTPERMQTVPSEHSSPATTDVVKDSIPARCGDIPFPTLLGADGASLTMDLVFYGDQCGYDSDGDAMFDDAYRPSRALLADGDRIELTSVTEDAPIVDIRPLEAGLVLRSIEPALSSPPPNAIPDDPYPIDLDGRSCVVITVDLRSDAVQSRFVALAENQPGACAAIDPSVSGP